MRIIKKLSKLFFILLILAIIGISGLYIVAYFMPNISLNTANSYLIYDNHDNLVFRGSNKNEWVSLDDIDKDFINYIINVEDQYFYYHKGFDIARIGKTLLNNIKARKITAGASSISQQYVKNLFLDFDQTWERKIEEAFLTIRLETHYSKDEILEGYLNTIYFGQGIYGIKDAAKYYFNKDVSDITMEEAIILSGIPKSPNNYNPLSNMEACKKRANVIANLLEKKEIITKDELNNLDFDNISLYGKKDSHNLDTLMYYQDAVINELYNIDTIPNSLITSGGLRIFTNLDIDAQRDMENGIKNFAKDDNNQIASISIEPETGKIIALAGGKNYSISQFNRVLKAKRQVGSTIKPFLYYSALESGMTASSSFKSEETTFVFSNNQKYSPRNYGDIYANKDISMNAALSYSDNIYAVKTHLFLGENELVKTLKACGLEENLAANPSLALGAKEISMIDYAKAYQTLANEGTSRDIYLINRVEDIDGNIIYQHKEEVNEVLDPSNVYIINEMMRNTYNYEFIDYTNPTIIYLNGKLKNKYAIKSGTTDNDYWIVGYNKKILNMVWAGNDNNENVPHAYSNIIKDIWLSSVSGYMEDIEDEWYDLPENVTSMPVDPITGKYKANSKVLFYYKKGTEVPYIK